MFNKKGMSGIVITLIIVLLSLAGIAIVWSVVGGLIKGNTEGIEISSKCLNTNIEVTQVTCIDGAVNKMCDVKLTRTGTETSELGGVKLVFKDEINAASSASAIDVAGNIAALVGKTATGIDSGIAIANIPNKVEVTPYFKDASGNEKLCSQTSSFSF
ncbi:hypothetical protein M0R19_01890 [Candidatus Pacearchaeota archaeon]|nr:hypothetical protein [Candidatus Pacearchaeota archaeon]